MKKRKTQAIMVMMVLLLLAANASALITTQLDIKPEYKTGEKVTFDYSIISDTGEEVEYYVSVECPSAPMPMIEMRTAMTPVNGKYVFLTVEDYMASQTCTAKLTVNGDVEEKDFRIITKPGFDVEVLSCKDDLCDERTKVFVKGEEIVVDYTSNVDAESESVLVFPDGSEEEIILPVKIIAKDVGAYNVEVKASKEGYKDVNVMEEFAVIEKKPDIKIVSECDVNGVCEKGENSQNCPQDCNLVEGEKTNFLIIALLVVIIAILVFITFYIVKSTRKGQLLEVENYIINTKKKGYKEEQIKKELLKDGWSENQIRTAFNRVKK